MKYSIKGFFFFSAIIISGYLLWTNYFRKFPTEYKSLCHDCNWSSLGRIIFLHSKFNFSTIKIFKGPVDSTATIDKANRLYKLLSHRRNATLQKEVASKPSCPVPSQNSPKKLQRPLLCENISLYNVLIHASNYQYQILTYISQKEPVCVVSLAT